MKKSVTVNHEEVRSASGEVRFIYMLVNKGVGWNLDIRGNRALSSNLRRTREDKNNK